MPEIDFRQAPEFIAGLSDFPEVILIYGEEYLYKKAFESLLDRMVPKEKRSFGYEPVSDDTDSIADIIERLNTFSLMPGRKVVALTDTGLFYSKSKEDAVWEKIKKAVDDDALKKASGPFRSLLSVKGIDYEKALTEQGKKTLKFTESFGNDDGWLKQLVDYCEEKNLKIPEATDNIGALKQAIEKGFPEDHHLIITTELIDKRKGLYTAIKERGLIVDCSVPKGDRKADKEQQALVLRESANRVLEKSGKQVAPDAYRYLIDMTGFDLRTFTDNLERLISFVGDRQSISLNDARSLLRRTKQDPIYELSGAFAERNLEKSLFFAGNLLNNGFYPLQIMATLVNQARKLVIARDFIDSLPSGQWRNNIDYRQFQSAVMPLVKSKDEATKAFAEGCDQSLTDPESTGKKKKKKKKATDNLLAPNPGSPYPIFLLLKNAGSYRMEELVSAYERLLDADRRLKSTGEDPRLVIEHALIHICKPM